MKYSIVIPTYNHCDDLLKPCVESILKQSNVADIELIISANGCKDNTFEYLGALKEKFNYLGLSDNLKLTWAPEALGYSRACNEGIKLATTDLIVLLNNDTILIPQVKNYWLDLLAAQFNNPKCGISCVIKGPSEPAGRDFAVFFCVMIHRKVFDKIGLLSLDYGVGGGEDTEFCIETENAGFEVNECLVKQWSNEAQMYVGDFPIYHKGEGTVHDASLVPDWNDIFLRNSLTLAKKYNPGWYKWRISNNAERGVFFKGDEVFPREKARYQFAVNNMVGKKVLEIGCSSGFGAQFMPADVEYLGIDYDSEIIVAANMQQWSPNARFVQADINALIQNYDPLIQYWDTIIAFETFEHIPNGLEVFEKLKAHCDRMFITVPYNENPGQFSPHHHLHNLTADKFVGATELGLLDIDGNLITDKSKADPNVEYNLVMHWDSKVKSKGDYRHALSFLQEQHAEIYGEVIRDNCYDIKPDDFSNGMAVLDIGANIGSFSLLAAYMGASKVIAVEPIGETFNHLINNVVRSGLTNIVTKKNLVTDKAGDVHKISINENSGHNSMYNVSERYEEVSTTTLADLLNEAGTNDVMLKLDCEGAEYDIVLNATQEQMDKVSRLVIEIHAELHPVHKGFQILEDKLNSFGFKRYDLKQIYSWTYGPNGEIWDMKPIPYRIELWKR